MTAGRDGDIDVDAAPHGAVRADKWLWRARFFKTRSLAAKAVSGGLRINGRRTDKPGAAVRPGDVLTFAQGAQVRVIEIAGLGERRGPAPEAQTLYADLSPPTRPGAAASAGRVGGSEESAPATGNRAGAPAPALDAGAPAPGPRPDRRARREGAAVRRGAP